MSKEEEKEHQDGGTIFKRAEFTLTVLPNTPLTSIRGGELLRTDIDSDVVRILREQLYP